MNAIAKGPDEKFCGDCGNVIKQKAEICPHCGCRQLPAPSPAVPAAGRNRIAAALMAFFIGAFGIHRFYLGRTVSGVLYLLFFWTFIPAILAFIETIRLLVMTDADFARRYP